MVQDVKCIRRLRLRSYYVAVSSQSWSPDKLIAWTGRRSDPGQEWYQNTLETQSEFIDRVKAEMA